MYPHDSVAPLFAVRKGTRHFFQQTSCCCNPQISSCDKRNLSHLTTDLAPFYTRKLVAVIKGTCHI